MKNIRVGVIAFLYLLFCTKLSAQELKVTAKGASSGYNITITYNLGVSGLPYADFQISLSYAGGANIYQLWSSPTGSITLPSLPGVSYGIAMTTTYPITTTGYASVTTPNPQPNSGNPPASCPSTFNGNLTFQYALPDGTPIHDGEIIISWIPTISNGLYTFRYRVANTSTWSYTGATPSQGFVYNGQRYAIFDLENLQQNGVEYEIQQSTYCTSTLSSSYSTSFFMTTLVD